MKLKFTKTKTQIGKKNTKEEKKNIIPPNSVI